VAFAAVLDANVLYTIAITDFFLTMAGYGLYRPHWSTQILAEIQSNLLKARPDLKAEQLAYRFEQMNRAHPGACVDPPPALVGIMTNHEKDRHVLAAAVASQASVIVTFNVKDFPAQCCEPYNVDAQHPDVFAEHLVDLNLGAAHRAVEEMSGRTARPHLEVPEVVERLRRDLPNAMARLAGI
jgi:predicted nucleic acid-binding protein